MSAAGPSRLWIRGIAALGGLLALAAVGLAADRQAPPLARSAAPGASSPGAAPLASLSPSPLAPSAPLPAPPPGAASMEVPQNPPGVLPDGRVVLNVASEEELRRLPGVGPARARAIVELRKRRGKFRSFSELLRVKGIGRKSLARMTPKMTLDPG
ncbi:MAG: helix-hairpin-helix domain-containing protein [Polyangiaceae bacterium]|nr:helix-hairpin-helix domain-containing protein [Polyangiaceae bacterium]